MPKSLRPYWNRLKKSPPGPEHDKNLRQMRRAMQQQLPLPLEMADELLDYFLAPPLSRDSLYKVEEATDMMLGESLDKQDSILSENDMVFMVELVNSWAMRMDMKVVTDFMRTAVARGYP